MKAKCLPSLILIIILTSCSSAICESVTCVNGDSINDTCQCKEGFVGERCDELPCLNCISVSGICNCDEGCYGVLCETKNIVGGYFITKLLYTDWPNLVIQYDLTASASEGRVCGLNPRGIKIYFSNALSIKDDGTMPWIHSIVLETEPGKFTSRALKFEQGTYTARNDKIAIKLNNGETRVAIISKNKLT